MPSDTTMLPTDVLQYLKWQRSFRQEDKMATKKNRIDFLPSMGKQLIAAMRSETLQYLRKHDGCLGFSLNHLYDLGAIPADFEARWNAERAIEDIMRKATEYGFVKKVGSRRWTYIGPDVREAEKKRAEKKDKRLKDIEAWARSKRLELESKPDHYDTRTVRVKLPKKLQVW